jgi:hypothetical protein
MNQNKEVGTKEEKLLGLFQKMTGSEKEGNLTLSEPLRNNIFALRRAGSDEEKLEIINRILVLIASDRICSEFLTVVFKDIDFSNLEKVEKCVDKFRYLSLLEYADFKDGFEIFRNEGDKLEKAWSRYFSPSPQKNKVPLSLEIIPAGQLYQLGYLAYSYYENVEREREKLREIFKEAQEKGIYTREEIETLAKEKGEDLIDLWANAGISEVDDLILSEKEQSPTSFKNLMQTIDFHCTKCERNQIEEAREKGQRNTIQYLSTQDIDVYIATSMRNPLDFSMNSIFVDKLRNHAEISDFDLTFFDPTQAYIRDRIQKGLLENIMVARTSVTVYNAQESDTFGKDAEAGLTHAFCKPVIVYVTRLFGEDLPKTLMEKIDKIGVYSELQKIYSDLDSLALEERDDFLNSFRDKDYLTEPEVEKLKKPDKDKNEAIEYIIDKKIKPLMNRLEDHDMGIELLQKGYSTSELEEPVVEFCIKRIKKLEERALLFRELHPLTFQISPLDGIARGVFVTRSVDKTAELLRALLMGKVEYEVKLIKDNIVLCDKITHSPIRAYPKAEEGEDNISNYIKKAISDLRSRLMSK